MKNHGNEFIIKNYVFRRVKIVLLICLILIFVERFLFEFIFWIAMLTVFIVPVAMFAVLLFPVVIFLEYKFLYRMYKNNDIKICNSIFLYTFLLNLSTYSLIFVLSELYWKRLG